MPSRRRRKPNLGTSSSSWLTISATLTSATPAARSARQTSTGWRTAVLTCSPSCSRRTSGVPVPAACVLYVPEVQGSLPPAPLVRSSAVHQRRYAEGGIPRTPQANSGVKLGNFYVQRACSPTRAALLTGRYNIRYGFQSGVLTDHNNYSLPLTETLLPQFVQRTRAAKAHAVGKWHLGYHRWEHTPTFRGFDSYLGCALRSPNPARYSEPEPEPKIQPKLSPKPEPEPKPKPRPNSQTIRATRTTSRTTAAAAASIFTWPTRLASE